MTDVFSSGHCSKVGKIDEKTKTWVSQHTKHQKVKSASLISLRLPASNKVSVNSWHIRDIILNNVAFHVEGLELFLKKNWKKIVNSNSKRIAFGNNFKKLTYGWRLFYSIVSIITHCIQVYKPCVYNQWLLYILYIACCICKHFIKG